MSNSNVYAIALKDTSPMLAYSPYRDINSRTSGWMLVSQNPDTTAHWSTMSGASFSLDFYGSGIVIYGSANAGAFSTSLDSKVTPGAPSDSILYETQGLDVGKHTLTLSLSNSDGLNITSVSVASAVGKSESTVVQVIRDTVHAINGAPVADSFFQTSGGTWIPHLDSYYRLDTTSVGGTLSFSFSHTSGIILYGSTNYDHSLFSVTMNPTAGATTSQRTFNATNSLLSYDSVLFFESGMVSSTTYTVRLENLASETYFELYSAHLLQTVEGSSDNGNSTLGLRGPNSHGLGTAPIVGIAVRCAVLLALLAIIAVLFWKRQQTQTTVCRSIVASKSTA
ncbi:hypothetical protein DL96DRAFT_1606288 [Flagelloscypha sp. PMI_526]|nr:hypothetical protein DL96DRAFT_1606288 [Flagelloscypha sp. PMI_526]